MIHAFLSYKTVVNLQVDKFFQIISKKNCCFTYPVTGSSYFAYKTEPWRSSKWKTFFGNWCFWKFGKFLVKRVCFLRATYGPTPLNENEVLFNCCFCKIFTKFGIKVWFIKSLPSYLSNIQRLSSKAVKVRQVAEGKTWNFQTIIQLNIKAKQSSNEIVMIYESVFFSVCLQLIQEGFNQLIVLIFLA